MSDLSTTYLGLSLKNPLIIGSSTLVQNIQGVNEAEESGAGAVVIRSLFEELIREKEEKSVGVYSGHPEEYDYLLSELNMQYGAQKYIELLQEAKTKCKIPIIASINCITPKWWISYAKQIQEAGADALELNLSLMPTDPGKTSLDIEQDFLEIIKSARANISIPIAVKIGPYFTSLTRFANQICGAGIKGLVLFNRFYQFDIDINQNKMIGANWYSSSSEMSLSLRWISILYKHVNCELCATTGIHTGEGLIKQLLAGAKTAEIVSAIYLKGFSIVPKILKELSSWMVRHNYRKLSEFRGKLSLSQQKDPEMYERLQYIRALTGIE